jgi:hypothetical protein
MVSLGDFIIYAYFFSDYYRLSAIFGVSYGMYLKLLFSAIASFVGFAAAILILVRSRKRSTSKLIVISLSIATLAGGVATLAVAIASYVYITNYSIFTIIPSITLTLYRVQFALIPVIVLFFWIFFSQLIRVRRAIVYAVVAISLVILFWNLVIANITAEEVQLTLSVNMDLLSSLITLVYWLVVFMILSISFFYYASKQKDERRITGAILGTAGIAAVMVQVSNLFAFLFSSPILEASIWVFAAAAFALMYFGLIPPKFLLPKEPKPKPKRTKRK